MTGGAAEGDDERPQRADQHQRPEDEPAALEQPRADRAQSHEEHGEQCQLEQDEVAIRARELRLRGRRIPPKRAASASAAAATLSPEARNSPPSAHVSLQIGWLLTLSSTPV